MSAFFVANSLLIENISRNSDLTNEFGPQKDFVCVSDNKNQGYIGYLNGSLFHLHVMDFEKNTTSSVFSVQNDNGISNWIDFKMSFPSRTLFVEFEKEMNNFRVFFYDFKEFSQAKSKEKIQAKFEMNVNLQELGHFIWNQTGIIILSGQNCVVVSERLKNY